MNTPLGSRLVSRRPLTVALIIALITLVVALHLPLVRLPTPVYEATDFLGYWAAASLLAHGENPYDEDALLALERDQGCPGSDPMYSWNPPWLHLILLPLGSRSVRQAAALWFVVNPILIGMSALLIWDVVGRKKGRVHISVVLLAAFLFSRSLHAVLKGQVKTLVLVGGAGFLALASQRRDFLAGATPVLPTVKPHVSYLLLPTVVIASLLWRRWGIAAGFGACLALLVLMVSLLFPDWPQACLSFFQVAASPLEPARYITPTSRGFLLTHANLDVGAWLAAASLAGFLILILLRGDDLSLPTIASLAWIVGLPTAPFSWSTDQVVLLLPIIQATSWMPQLTARQKWMATVVLVVIYAYALWIWLARYRDVAFLRIPLIIGLLWGCTYWAISAQRRTKATDSLESASETRC